LRIVCKIPSIRFALGLAIVACLVALAAIKRLAKELKLHGSTTTEFVFTVTNTGIKLVYLAAGRGTVRIIRRLDDHVF